MKPTVPIKMYETIGRLSYISNTPIKDVSEAIVIKGLASEKVIDHFSPQFVRDYWKGETLYVGNRAFVESRIIRVPGVKRRVSMRFNDEHYTKLQDFSYAMDLTPTSGTVLMLQGAILHTDIVHSYIEEYAEGHLDDQRKKH